MKSNLPVRLLPSLVFGLITLSPSASFAELPKGNSFLLVGTFNQGNRLEASYYIDKSSIQEKGNQLYYTQWIVWKYEQPDYLGHQYQYSKTQEIADCRNWKLGQFGYSDLDRNGAVVNSAGSDFTMKNPQPDSIGFKAMNIVCKGHQ